MYYVSRNEYGRKIYAKVAGMPSRRKSWARNSFSSSSSPYSLLLSLFCVVNVGGAARYSKSMSNIVYWERVRWIGAHVNETVIIKNGKRPILSTRTRQMGMEMCVYRTASLITYQWGSEYRTWNYSLVFPPDCPISLWRFRFLSLYPLSSFLASPLRAFFFFRTLSVVLSSSCSILPCVCFSLPLDLHSFIFQPYSLLPLAHSVTHN